MKFISFFAGIGGIDLGLERAGHECVGQVEIDDFCQKVLHKHWPNVPKWRDIRELTGRELPEADLWCGGFPCQDISVGGYGVGIRGRRSGLFFELARLVRKIRPRYVLLENVAAILVRGMGEVLGELAQIGFDAEWRMLRASDFGAPHQRSRLFIVAYRDSKRIEGGWKRPLCRQPQFSWCEGVGGPEDLRGRPDVPEPLVRRIDDGIRRRVDSVGNAVVPQVAEYIGRLLKEAEE